MQEQESPIAAAEGSIRRRHLRVFLRSHVVDFAFVAFLFVLAVQYYSHISSYQAPMWDAAAYLANARGWLTNTPLFEIYRPPLISWMMAGVWTVVGENWENVKYLSALFGIGAAVVFYLNLRRDKSALFALSVVVLTMMNPQAFFYSTQLYTETLSLFFLLATLYLAKSERPILWSLAGITGALAFASRYPTVLQVGIILFVESYARKNWRIVANAISSAIPVVSVIVLLVFLKTGTFQTALAKDTSFTVWLSPYYLQNSVAAWGWVFLLIPIAFILRTTYSNRYNWVFITWLVLSILFWSANATNQQERFTIQITPAVNFLAILTLETFIRNTEPLRQFLRRELIFLPKPHLIQSS